LSSGRPRNGRAGPGDRSRTLDALLGIRELIHSGQARAGERLSELALVERLGLSRTPVRAALARLEQEGLVEAIASGGYAVRAFSAADVADAIELRGVLEGTAARLAAERGCAASALEEAHSLLRSLGEAIGAEGERVRFDDYVACNERFHALLASMCGSPVIARGIERAVSLPFASPSAFLGAQAELPRFRAELVAAQHQHRAIIEAIERREGARAEALAREHARLAQRNLGAVLDSDALMERVPGLASIRPQT